MAGLLSIIKRLLNDADDEEEMSKYTGFRVESISPNIVVIPSSDDITETDVRYPLIKPFADAHIYWDDDEDGLKYEVDEPVLTEDEERMFRDLRDALEEKIDVPLSELDTQEKVVDYLESQIVETAKELGYRMTEEEENKIMYYVYRNFAGLDDIEPLMHDPHIEDIGCSGLGIPVYIVHSKFGSIKTDITFTDEEKLKNLVVKLAERSNKYVSYAEPLLDGTLPDGSRVNASLTQDVTTKGPTFSIRKFQEVPYSAIDMVELGTANFELMAYMWMVMQYQQSMLVIGGTAAGKTTFLNSIVTFIPPEHKIVSIEDTRELQLPHQNWIPAVTRSGVGLDSKEQEISMYQLLRESFRQNPDYVVVGEVRGEEASVLFQGMASGHPSISTMHASAPSDVVSRLTTPPINLSSSLVETLDIIVSMTHASQYGKNARRVQAVHEIEDISESGSLRTNEHVSWEPIDDSFDVKSNSSVLDRIQQQFGMSNDELREELNNRKRVLEWMKESGYTHFSEVARIVTEYYNDKERVLNTIEEGSSQSVSDLFADASATPIPDRNETAVAEIEESIQQGGSIKDANTATEDGTPPEDAADNSTDSQQPDEDIDNRAPPEPVQKSGPEDSPVTEKDSENPSDSAVSNNERSELDDEADPLPANDTDGAAPENPFKAEEDDEDEDEEEEDLSKDPFK